MVNLAPKSTVLNTDFVELDCLGNFSWSGAALMDLALMELSQIGPKKLFK